MMLMLMRAQSIKKKFLNILKTKDTIFHSDVANIESERSYITNVQLTLLTSIHKYHSIFLNKLKKKWRELSEQMQLYKIFQLRKI